MDLCFEIGSTKGPQLQAGAIGEPLQETKETRKTASEQVRCHTRNRYEPHRDWLVDLRYVTYLVAVDVWTSHIDFRIQLSQVIHQYKDFCSHCTSLVCPFFITVRYFGALQLAYFIPLSRWYIFQVSGVYVAAHLRTRANNYAYYLFHHMYNMECWRVFNPEYQWRQTCTWKDPIQWLLPMTYFAWAFVVDSETLVVPDSSWTYSTIPTTDTAWRSCILEVLYKQLFVWSALVSIVPTLTHPMH